MTAKKALLTGMTMVAVLAVGAGRAHATNVGAGANMSAIQASVTGDGIINFDQTATLTMDADATGVASITVANTVTGTIAFGNSGTRKIIFTDAAGAITLNGNGALTITGTDATAGFDFYTTAGTASARTLTITSSSADSLGDDVGANRIMLGRNNILTFATGGGAANAADSVVIVNNTGGVPTLDINNAVAIDTLSISTSGEDLDVDIASGVTLTVDDAMTLAGDSLLEVIAVTGGGAETMTMTGGLTLGGTSVLRFTNDSGVLGGTVTAGAAGVTVDANGSSTIATLTPTNNITLDVAAGKSLTITNAVTVPTTKTVTFLGTNDASAETLTLSGGMTLAGSTAKLNTTGDNTTAMVVGGTITTSTADGAVLDIDATTTLTGLTPTFSVTLDVAAAKTLTITNAVTVPTTKIVTFQGTNDASAETLVLSGGMTLAGSAAEINVLGDTTTAMVVNGTITTSTSDGAVVDIDATTTLTGLTPTLSVDLQVASGKTLTITNAVTVPTNKIVTFTGVADGSTETLVLTGGMTLNASGAELNIVGDTTTAQVVSGAVISGADGTILDVDASTTLTTLTPTNNIDLQVASAKTLTITNTVTVPTNKTVTFTGVADASAETLVLTGGMTLAGSGAELNTAGDTTTAQVVSGTITTSTADGAVLDIDASTTLTGLTPTFSIDIQVAAAKTLTITNAVTVPTTKTVTFTGTNDASAETLVLTGGMTLAGSTARLNVTGDNTTAQVVTGTITTSTANGAIVDIDATTTLTGLTPTFGADLQIAQGKTLTITNAVTVPASKIVTFTGTNDASAETLVLTGGLALNGSAAEFNITGDNTTAQAVTGNVTVGVDGGILDVDASASITAVNMTTTLGDLTLEVATGKTLTTTVDVNANTLTLSETGTVSTVTLDTANATIQANATETISTLNHTAAGIINLGNTVNLTVTNPIALGANKLTLNGSGAGAQDTFTATVQLNNAASELEIAGADVDNITGTTITVSADGATLDTNISTAPTAVNMTAGTGDLTLQVATGKTLTATIDVNDNQLTVSEAGTVTTVQLDTAGGVLKVDESAAVTAVNGTANFTINVASGKTLSTTATIAANTLTFTGTGTVSRVDATTGTITDNGGTTVSDLRATFGAGGTFTWGGTGSGTVTTLANALPGAGETLNKVGSGSLAITSGFTTSFAAAAGVKLDIDGGTVVIGSAGTNDDITFNDDADEITIASGAALTTYGSFSVGAAGANVNLDAAAGSTVNLSSTGGAESFTGQADDDYNLLGTVNINGSNGDYTIADAFNYKFGSININTTGSLINNQANGEIKFVPNSVVALTGSGTFTVNGQATGTRITLDTTTGSGKFTFDVNSSPNFTIQNANVTNSTYTDDVGRPGSCTYTFTNVTLTETINYTGDCSAGTGGTTTPTAPTEPTEPEDTDTDTDTDTDMPTDDTPDTGEDTTTPPDTTPPDMTDDTPTTPEVVVKPTDDTGSANLNNEKVDVVIDGLGAGTTVKLDTDANGATRLTVGDEANPDLLVTLTGAEDGAGVDVSVGQDGSQTLLVTGADGSQTLSVNVNGLGDQPEIQASIDADGNQTVVLHDAAGASFSLDLNSLPTNADVSFATAADGSVNVEVDDPSNDHADLSLDASNVFRSFGATITYDDFPSAPGARVSTGYPGLANDQALGGSVTLSATGLQTSSAVTVSLAYTDADATGIDESALRVHRYNASTGEYLPAGDTDQGVRAPTGVVDDYGVDTAVNSAWAVVSTLGKYAVGVPKAVQATPTTTTAPCAAGGLCGTAGMLALPLGLLGLMGMKRTIRRS